MSIEPSFDVFEQRFQAREAQCLAMRLVSDLETPVSAYLKMKTLAGAGPSFLLESVEGGAVRGRYSMIGLEPDLIWRCHRGEASVCRPALGDAFLVDPRPAFESLRALLAESAIPDGEALAGGEYCIMKVVLRSGRRRRAERRRPAVAGAAGHEQAGAFPAG